MVRFAAHHLAEAFKRSGDDSIAWRGEAKALEDADAVGFGVAESGELQANDFLGRELRIWKDDAAEVEADQVLRVEADVAEAWGGIGDGPVEVDDADEGAERDQGVEGWSQEVDELRRHATGCQWRGPALHLMPESTREVFAAAGASVSLFVGGRWRVVRSSVSCKLSLSAIK